MRTAIRRRGDAPEDQDAEQEPPEIVGIGNLDAEEIAQQHRDEDVDGNQTDKECRDQLDAVDETVHRVFAFGRRCTRELAGDFSVGQNFSGHRASGRLVATAADEAAAVIDAMLRRSLNRRR
jgi:hypothetical protein